MPTWANTPTIWEKLPDDNDTKCGCGDKAVCLRQTNFPSGRIGLEHFCETHAAKALAPSDCPLATS
jgi:hypothetical protein